MLPPDHAYELAPLAVSTTVALGQDPLVTDAELARLSEGIALLTCTVKEAEVVQLAELVAITEYMVAFVGDTTIEGVVAPLLQL